LQVGKKISILNTEYERDRRLRYVASCETMDAAFMLAESRQLDRAPPWKHIAYAMLGAEKLVTPREELEPTSIPAIERLLLIGPPRPWSSWGTLERSGE